MSTPSSPAMTTAAHERYGLAEGSGVRNSRRLAAGFAPVKGILTQALRLRWECTRFTGASYPGTSRR